MTFVCFSYSVKGFATLSSSRDCIYVTFINSATSCLRVSSRSKNCSAASAERLTALLQKLLHYSVNSQISLILQSTFHTLRARSRLCSVDDDLWHRSLKTGSGVHYCPGRLCGHNPISLLVMNPTRKYKHKNLFQLEPSHQLSSQNCVCDNVLDFKSHYAIQRNNQIDAS